MIKYKKSIIIITLITLIVMLPPIVYPPLAANAQEQNQKYADSSINQGMGRQIRCGWGEDIGNALANSLRGLGTWIWDAMVSGIGWCLVGVLDVLGVTPMLDGCLTGENDMNDLEGDIQLGLPDSADSSDWPPGTSIAVKINNWMWHLVYALLGIVFFAVFIGRIIPGMREKTKGKTGSIIVALILTPATLYICKLVITFNAALCKGFTDYFLVTGSYGSAGEAIVKGLIAPSITAGMVTLIIPLIVILLLIVWLVMLYFRHIIIVISVALMPAMPILLCFDSTSGFAKKFITTFVEWTFLLFFYDVIIVFAIAAEAQSFWGPFNAIGFLAFMVIMPKMYFQSTSAVSKAVSGAVKTGALMAASAGGAALGAGMMSPALKAGKLAGKGVMRGGRGVKDAASRMSKGLQAGKAVRTGKAVPTQGRFANDARAFANATPKERKIAAKGESRKKRQEMWRDDKENRQIQRDHRDGITSHKNKAEKDTAVKEQKQLSSNIKRSQGKMDRHGLSKGDNERWVELKNKPRSKAEQQEFNELNKKRDQYDTGGGRSKDMGRIHELKQQEQGISQKEKDYNDNIEQRGVGWDNKRDKGLMKTDMKEKIAQAKNERKVAMKGGSLPSGLNEGERSKAEGLDVDIKKHEKNIKTLKGRGSQGGKPGRSQNETKEKIGGQNFLKRRREKDKNRVLKGPEKRLEEQYKEKKREMKKQQPSRYQNMKTSYKLGKERKGLVKKYVPKPKKKGGRGGLIGGMMKIPLAVIG